MKHSICAALALAMIAAAQPAAVRTETGPVVVKALVRDKQGKPVSGLGARDFRVFEDSKEQPIASVAPESATGHTEPVFVAFLFDAAGYAIIRQAAAENRAHRDAAGFAGADAGPNRYLAVMDLDVNGSLFMAQDFTTLGDRVRQAAEDVSHSAGAGRGFPR